MKRCDRPEQMEDPSLSGDDLRNALGSMDRFHDLLGSLRVFEQALDPLIGNRDRPLTVCDIGAGSGYLGQRLHRRHGEDVHYIRVEPSARIVNVCPPRPWETVVRGRCPGLPFPANSLDVVFSSLVMHHVPDGLLNRYLRESRSIADQLVIHHDLLRSPIAYGLTWLFTRVASNSPVAQSDGPLSVRRSRTREEWEEFLRSNHSQPYRIEPQWPWRINLRWEAGPSTAGRTG